MQVPTSAAGTNVLATGAADIKMLGVFDILPVLDAEQSVVVLAGIHVGCYELFGNDRIHAIRDLRRKTVAVSGLGAGDHLFIATMLAYVGVDPKGKSIGRGLTPTPSRCVRSPKVLQMPSSPSLRNPKNCERRKSDTS